MDNAFCNVIYVDSAVKSREFIAEGQSFKHALGEEKANLEQNVKLLLDVFGGGMYRPPLNRLVCCQ